MKIHYLILIAATASMLGSCSYAPKHEIPVRPDYIRAGVQPGDTVEIVTRDGEKIELVVTAVEPGAIVGEDRRIAIRDIDSISKRSWSEPAHPCGAGEPVGCSVPGVVLVLSDDYEDQVEKFKKPCQRHDFCYRHGYATYGIDREQCDAEFYDHMREACGSDSLLGIADPKELAICELAANRTYEAVRKHGEPAYRTTNSTYCEYQP